MSRHVHEPPSVLIHLSVHLSIYLSIARSIYLSTCLSMYPATYPSICLSIYLSLYPSLLSVCFSLRAEMQDTKTCLNCTVCLYVRRIAGGSSEGVGGRAIANFYCSGGEVPAELRAPPSPKRPVSHRAGRASRLATTTRRGRPSEEKVLT